MSQCYTRRSGYPLAESHRNYVDHGKLCPPVYEAEHKKYAGWYDDFMSGRPSFDTKFAFMKKDLDKTNWSGSKMAPLAANSFKPPEIVFDKSSEYRSHFDEKKHPKEFQHLFAKVTKADDPPAVGICPGVFPTKYEPVPQLFK